MEANFLLHKVNKSKYWYISQQIPVNGIYKHFHLGGLRATKDGYIFSPNMNIFNLPKKDVKRLQAFIGENFKNTKWKIAYNYIIGGIELQEKVTRIEKKQTIKKKELVYQK